MKRKTEYTPKAFDKIIFDLRGVRRLGVVLDYDGILAVRCIDSKAGELHQFDRKFSPKPENIKVVGKVKPHKDAYDMVCDYIADHYPCESNTVEQKWIEWFEKAPGVALCTCIGDDIVLCEIEKLRVTYKYVGEFHTKTVPDDDSTGDLYQVLRRSDGKICIRNPRTKEITVASPDELYSFFLNNSETDNDFDEDYD